MAYGWDCEPSCGCLELNQGGWSVIVVLLSKLSESRITWVTGLWVSLWRSSLILLAETGRTAHCEWHRSLVAVLDCRTEKGTERSHACACTMVTCSSSLLP